MSHNVKDVFASVITITYNQEDYIGQAIDSALAQKCEFPFELIIVDDDSSDSTRDILSKYDGNPRVTIILNETNIGPNASFFKGIDASNGKYVANLEGDDYWVDDKKLQKQITFLESNKNVSCLGTNAYVKYEPSEKLFQSYVSQGITHFTSADLLLLPLAHSCTMVYRKELLAVLPRIEMQPYDFLMHIYLAQEGQAVRMEEYTSVYRKHDYGIWSSRSLEDKRQSNRKLLDYIRQNQLSSEDELLAFAFLQLKNETEFGEKVHLLEKGIFEFKQKSEYFRFRAGKYYLMMCYFKTQRWFDFIELYEDLVASQSNDLHVEKIYCQFLFISKRYECLYQKTEELIDQFPDDFALCSLNIKSLYFLGHIHQAHNTFREVKSCFGTRQFHIKLKEISDLIQINDA